ncbi:MAG: SH3 domain-containing protein [Clostridia bacterium]|nr:SH3 domain-containing protein [Clostridia bacterium]
MDFKKIFTKKLFKKTVGLILAVLILSSAFIGSESIRTAASGEAYKAGIVSVSSGRLNVRSSPSTSSSVKTTLSKGSYVTLISKSGIWWKVQYGSASYGYCSSTYIKEATGTSAYVDTASTKLNIRSGASTSSAVITQLAKGTSVIILSESGSFYKILFNGVSTGYAHKNYVSKYSSGVTSGAETISLSVPSFKQYDSRWKYHEVGNSGQTIYKIGCLTTCVAMNKSYITGSTIYPNEMEAQLSYTSGGALYWPSEYKFYTSSDYLNKILTELKDGNAVIIGGKNSYGAQHWVVVKGYTENGSVTADDFAINDPGSATRTTLSQFLSAYPRFYKLAYI